MSITNRRSTAVQPLAASVSAVGSLGKSGWPRSSLIPLLSLPVLVVGAGPVDVVGPPVSVAVPVPWSVVPAVSSVVPAVSGGSVVGAVVGVPAEAVAVVPASSPQAVRVTASAVRTRAQAPEIEQTVRIRVIASVFAYTAELVRRQGFSAAACSRLGEGGYNARTMRWFIGDLQGCAREFEDLLRKIRFDPQADELWCLGDLVNRGPDSLAALRLWRDVGGRGVVGNHDVYALLIAAGRWPRKHDTLGPLLAAPEGPELLARLRAMPALQFLAAGPGSKGQTCGRSTPGFIRAGTTCTGWPRGSTGRRTTTRGWSRPSCRS
ncbi:metallophosphoesterase [Nannocystis pusilla]|uniref:metallophosphoesterase n=1 Tax=Nannocystis pusilla TaxID=889268 RepID=UPI003B770933